MNADYECFIVFLFIVALILLVMVLWEYGHKRSIKAPARVLKALLVSLAGVSFVILTNDVEGITARYWLIMAVSLYVFLTVLLHVFLNYKHKGMNEKAGSILVVLLMIFLAAAIASRNNIYISSVLYEVSVVVENGTDPQEDVVLYIPLPDGYPGDFVSFHNRNHAVIPTEHGRMLLLSTSTNVTLKTTLKDDWIFIRDYLKYAPDDEPDLTTRSGNQVYFFLQNTSCNVSVSLYFETQLEGKSYYMAVGCAVYGLEDSDSEHEQWVPGSQKLQLSPGWNEIVLSQDEYLEGT